VSRSHDVADIEHRFGFPSSLTPYSRCGAAVQ
jgi:hypothetical protein